MDTQALVDEVWSCELAANECMLRGDVAGTRALTSPDLIHFLVDGSRGDLERLLGYVAAARSQGLTAIKPGRVEAIVLAQDAVLLTYPLRATLVNMGVLRFEYEHASVLWLRRDLIWHTAWIHASPLADGESRFAAGDSSGHIISIQERIDGESGAPYVTAAERTWEAINAERAAVDAFVHHDLAAAEAATAVDAIIIEVDGSRRERSSWLSLVGDWHRTLEAPDYGPMQVIAVTNRAMLVAYTMRTRGTYDGKLFTNAEALSALWLRQQGTWLNVFSQASTIIDP
ncbi:MAG: DUF4440 domain-containing protein [Caldilineaceae bacterium]